jgi:hypothetical protein
MASDIRSYLVALGDHLLEIRKEVNPATEMGALCSESQRPLLFRNINGYPGWRVCDILVKTRTAQAIALRTTPDNVLPELALRLAQGTKPWKVVEDGPVREVVWRGKDEQDWSDLVVQAPPLFIQEKVHPKAIIDDLKRRSNARREAETDAPDEALRRIDAWLCDIKDFALKSQMKLVMVMPDAEDLKKIKVMVEEGWLKPFVAETFGLDQLQQAHQKVEKGGFIGKIAVEIV